MTREIDWFGRVAAIYDIHGNLPALEAVLDEIAQAGVDLVVVGGDVVPGPMPHETLARLLELDIATRFILGNGDREVLAERGGKATTVPERFRDVMRHSARALSAEQAELIAGWPTTERVSIRDLGDVLFCHASPRNDTEIFTKLTPEERLLPVFAGVDATTVVCGHTHMQFDRAVGATRVVNAGSVGMPYGVPGAYWLLLGPGVEPRHTAYDLAKAAERIRRTTYPHAEDFAANNLLQPPSEHAMLERLDSVELK